MRILIPYDCQLEGRRISSARAIASALSTFLNQEGRMILPSTVLCSKRRSFATYNSRPLGFSSPSRTIRPDWTSKIPAIRLKRVVFPTPLGPRIETTSPEVTCRLISSKIFHRHRHNTCSSLISVIILQIH